MICFDINQVDLKGPDCDFQDQTDMLFKNITPESTSGKPWLKGFLTHCSLAISVGRFFSSPLLLCTENQDLILNTQDAGGQGWSYLHPPTAPSSRSTARSNLKGVWFYVLNTLLIIKSELWTHNFCDIGKRSNWLSSKGKPGSKLLSLNKFPAIIFILYILKFSKM